MVNEGPHENRTTSVCVCVREGALVCSYIKEADGAEAGGTRPPKSPVCMCACVCEPSRFQETGANSQQICWFRHSYAPLIYKTHRLSVHSSICLSLLYVSDALTVCHLPNPVCLYCYVLIFIIIVKMSAFSF